MRVNSKRINVGQRPNIVILTACLCVALALGGAGVSYPMLACVVELVSIAILCWLLPRALSLNIPSITIAALAGIVVIALFPMLQLVPLPWSLWSALPGRELAASIRTAAGMAGIASPLTLRPDATWRAALALIPPACAFVSLVFLDEKGRIAILRAIVAFAVLSAVLGALQLASAGTGIFALFASAHRGDALGLFVNHNHHATFLLIGIVAASTPGVLGQRQATACLWEGVQWPAVLGIAILLSLTVLGTRSRTGVISLPAVLLLSGYLQLQGRRNARWILFGCIVLAIAAAALAETSLARTALERFSHLDLDNRPVFWSNTIYAIGQFLPWGAGLGTFATVYPGIEPLDQVMLPIVNHAHNDYLELALEGGVAALLLLAGGLCLTMVAFVRSLRRSGADALQSKSLTLAAGAIVAIILLHSLDDYPLRMYALSVPFAACTAMLFPRGRRWKPDPKRRRQSLAVRVLVAVAGLVLALQVTVVEASSHFLLSGEAAQAVRWWPGNAEGWSRLATERELQSDWAGGALAARAALMRSPMDVAAVRALALAEAAGRREASAEQLMLLAGQLGWRDVPTRLWLIQRALELHEPVVAVQRADGLLRQGSQFPPLFGQLRTMLADQAATNALAGQLAQRPSWRRAFLASLGGDARIDGGNIVRLYRQLAAGGAPSDPAESAPLLEALWQAGRYQDARAVWTAAGGAGWIADGEFEQSDEGLRGQGPFAWQSLGLPGVIATVERPESAWHGRALHVESQGIGAGAIAREMLVLAPGRYVLRFAVRPDANMPKPPYWRLLCLPSRSSDPVATTDVRTLPQWGWDRTEVRFQIDPGCKSQELQLVIPPAYGTISFWLDGINLSKISQTER